MRRTAIFFALAAALLAAPQAVTAQTQSYHTCSFSGNNFLSGLCFNWELSHTAGTNTILLKVQNPGPTTGNLNAFAIWLPRFNPASIGTLSGVSAVNTTTSGTPSTGAWSTMSIDPPLNHSAGFDMGAGTGTGNEGICFGAPGGSCWFTPANGYLNFTFTFASTFNTLDLTGAAAGGKWQGIGGNDGPSYTCGFTTSDAIAASSFGACSTTTETPVALTPEPSSWLLMASGLLGLGFVARGRRRA